MSTTWLYYNMRSTEGAIDDGPDGNFGGVLFSTGTTDQLGETYGWSVLPAFGEGTNLDPRLHGCSNASSVYATFRVDRANGIYRLQLPLGVVGIAASSNVTVYDGDGTVVTTPLYAQTAATSIPDGSVLDVDGNIKTYAAWQASPAEVEIEITQGYITFVRGTAPLRMFTAGLATPTPTPTVFNKTQLLAAIAAASAGDTIWCAGGDYGDINPPARSMADPITVASADRSDPVIFTNQTKNGMAIRLDTGWDGLVFDGVKIVKDETGTIRSDVVNAPCYLDGASNITFQYCIVHGDMTRTDDHCNCSAFDVRQGSNITITKNRIERIRYGVKLTNTNDALVTYNRFVDMQSDGIIVGAISDGLTLSYNLFDGFTPYDVPPPYNDHPDPIQLIVSGSPSNDAITNVEIGYNMVKGTDGWVQPQGWYPDNESANYLALSNFWVHHNVSLGAQYSAIYMNGVGGGSNLVEYNELYNISDQTGGPGNSRVRFVNTIATYGHNIGTIYDQAGNTLTNAGGGSATGSVTEAQANTMVADFSATYLSDVP